MSTKRTIGLGVAGILLLAGAIDAYRYLKPEPTQKQEIQPQNTFPVASGQELILVYNAYGGIYPGLVDFIHKEFFPASYPCNLCYQTFGTFSMKAEWRQFLDSLPLKITELHKDGFKRRYSPENVQLPVILVRDSTQVQLLVSAAEMNKVKSLPELTVLVKSKLTSGQIFSWSL